MNKKTYDINKRVDTSTLKKRLDYGLEKEEIFYNMMRDNNIYLIWNDNKTNEIFNWKDFKYLNDNINIYIELKSRTVSKDRYDTTILKLNKVQSYLKNKIPDKKNYYYIVFSFITDDNDLEYWYIHYKKELFKSFDKCTIFNEEHYRIPITELKPINDLYNVFKNIK